MEEPTLVRQHKYTTTSHLLVQVTHLREAGVHVRAVACGKCSSESDSGPLSVVLGTPSTPEKYSDREMRNFFFGLDHTSNIAEMRATLPIPSHTV